MVELSLSPKQQLGLELLDDPTVTDIYWGGSAGSGKTLMLCIWTLIQCRQYPGIRIGMGRKELTRLKQTTVFTLLREAHPMMNISHADFNYQDQKALITYNNGSSIQLVDLARQPSDPDYDTLGSLNLSHILIDEVGEVTKKAKDVLGSRKNRFLNKEYGIVGKTVLTGNPSQNFTRDEYYEPYKNLGGGDFQKWPSGQVEVNGKIVTAYRAFIRALPTDNPFLPRNYIEVLKSLPMQERKRLYEGNWDYMDDDNMLFKSYILDRSYITEYETGRRVLGFDISDKGKDETIGSLIDNGVLVWQKSIPVDPNSPITIGDQIADGIVRMAQQNGMTHKDVGFDVLGIGATTRDSLKRRGWFCHEFDAGAPSTEPGYQNARSERFWKSSQHLEKGERHIHSENPTNEELRRQLLAHEYESDDGVKVIPKKKIKEMIGRSPDNADSYIIADWVYDGAPTKHSVKEQDWVVF